MLGGYTYTIMHTNSLFRLAVLAVCFVLSVNAGIPRAGASDDDAVKRLVSDFWEWQLRINPSKSTGLGVSRYNDQMEQYGLKQLDFEKGNATEFMNRLQAIDPEKLGDQLMNYKTLKDSLQTFLEGAELARYGGINPINNYGGIHMYDRPYMPRSASTQTDYNNYIKRLNAVPSQVDGMKELMRYAIQTNRTLHNVSMSRVVTTLDMLIFDTPEESLFYSAYFLERLANTTLDTSIKDQLRRDGKAAVQGYMLALKDLRAFLLNEYLPNTRTEPGLWAVDQTNGFYKACLNFHLSSNMDPAVVHQLGLTEVERITKEMNKTLKTIGFDGTIQEFFESLKTDPRFYTNNATELLDIFKKTIFETIQPKLDTILSTVPSEPLLIEDSAASGFVAAYYPSSNDEPGRFVISLARPNESSLASVMALSLHEALPGHHLQFSYIDGTDLPEFRKRPIAAYVDIPNTFPFYTAYVEGWALYTEYLGEEMGLYDDGYKLMGRYSEEILRACRLVVDTGVHYMRWSRSYAVQYLMKCSSSNQRASEQQIDRYITLPGQACAYKIGEIKILKLRKHATDQLGSNFDLKGFHKTILENGPMSMDMLEDVVKAWVKDEAEKFNVNAAQPFLNVNAHFVFTFVCTVGARILLV